MYKKLTDKGVPYSFKDISNAPGQLAAESGATGTAGALWFFMIRQMQTAETRRCRSARAGRGCSPCSRKRSRSKTWRVDEAKEELHEIIEFLREAQKFQKLGAAFPKACCWWDLRNRQNLAGARGCG